MCHVELNKNCHFVDMFEFYSTFWNLIIFIALHIFTELHIFFCSINIYILPCKLDLCVTWNRSKVTFCRSFWIFWNFFHFLASQIFTKLQKIINSINIYILPCKLDLCVTLNRTKSVILSIFLNFPLRFGT